jgi:hypothetical protein
MALYYLYKQLYIFSINSSTLALPLPIYRPYITYTIVRINGSITALRTVLQTALQRLCNSFINGSVLSLRIALYWLYYRLYINSSMC